MTRYFIFKHVVCLQFVICLDTKKRGEFPDFSEGIILKTGATIEKVRLYVSALPPMIIFVILDKIRHS
jgi:hypothetical protein